MIVGCTYGNKIIIIGTYELVPTSRVPSGETKIDRATLEKRTLERERILLQKFLRT